MAGTTSRTAACLCGVNRKTAAFFYHRLREVIAHELEAESEVLFGADTKGGAIVYWSKFYKAGIGLDDLRYPQWFQALFGVQERVQRWVAYVMLPLGLALLSLRCLQGCVQIWRGERNSSLPATKRKSSSPTIKAF